MTLNFPWNEKYAFRDSSIERKKKLKKKKTKVQRSLIFLPFEIVAKFYREFLSAKDFQDINNTKRWIRRKLRMDVKKIVKCGKWWPPLGGSCCNRFTIYHSVPDFKHSSYTRAQWTAQSVTYEILVNLYIYTPCNSKIAWKRRKWRKWIKFRSKMGRKEEEEKKSIEF